MGSPGSPTSASTVPSQAPSYELPTRRSRPRPQLQRSQSEIPVVTNTSAQPTFPPDLSAMDLSLDQIKKNYSVDNFQRWDKAKYPLPPLTALTGIGRYRTSINADPEWRNCHYRKQVSDLSGLDRIVSELDMATINGLSSQEWQALTSTASRRGSAMSSNSTQTTTSSVATYESGNVPQDCNSRVVRGFSPSASSSARSSFNTHSRKGSTLAIVTKPVSADESLFQKSLQRQNTSFLSEQRNGNALSTINELQPNALGLYSTALKMQKPCEFTSNGDPESAVASDAEDDDDETAWTDELEPARVSAITQMFKEGQIAEPRPTLTRLRTTSGDKKHGRSIMIGLDRSKTIRVHAAPPRRRKSSKVNNDTQLKLKLEPETTNIVLPTPESAEDGSVLTMQLHKRTSTLPENNQKQPETMRSTTISKVPRSEKNW